VPGDAHVAELVDGLLEAVTAQFDRPLPTALREAFHRAPRHRFLPDRVWTRDGAGGYTPLDRTVEPERWLAAAYTDTPLVTQFTDGLPSSAASMPSMVARMLLLTGLAEPSTDPQEAACRVLELGAGTGFNAALLCALAGEQNVVTIELDPVLATEAEANLKDVGFTPTVARGDAVGGWPTAAPYGVVLATFSVDRIPPAWLAQVRTGGRIVTPWTSAWCRYGTLELTASHDGTAAGRFHGFASFMPMTHPASRGGDAAAAAVATRPGTPAAGTGYVPDHSGVNTDPAPQASAADTGRTPHAPGPNGGPTPHNHGTAGTGTARNPGTGAAHVPCNSAPAPETVPAAGVSSSTSLSPWVVAGGDLDVEFHLGLTVPGAAFAWDTSGDHAHTRLEITDDTTGSWAAVDYDGRTATTFAVTQAGPRALWDEITAAHARWEHLGRPAVEQHGLTVTADGTTTVWVGSPAVAVSTV
jgi:protein-L-isoaspartate O-methyltransferase